MQSAVSRPTTKSGTRISMLRNFLERVQPRSTIPKNTMLTTCSCFGGRCPGDTFWINDIYSNHDYHYFGHERFEHCNTFENGMRICTTGLNYRFDGYFVDRLPGQDPMYTGRYELMCDRDRKGRKHMREWDHQDKTLEHLSDCTEHCRYAFPNTPDVTGACNITDPNTGLQVPKTSDQDDRCRRVEYRNLRRWGG